MSCRAAAAAAVSAVSGCCSGTWTMWRNQWMNGADVYGSTVGIVGFGRIGLCIAKRLRGFGCRILYSNPREKPREALQVDAEFVSFDALLARADFVLPQCPLNAATRHLFSAPQFRAMRRSAIFINTTRGQVVDQEALLQALQEGWIAAAGLDVTDPEPISPQHALVQLPNCVILPHIGSATVACRRAMMQRAADNLVHFSKGEMDKVEAVNRLA